MTKACKINQEASHVPSDCHWFSLRIYTAKCPTFFFVFPTFSLGHFQDALLAWLNKCLWFISTGFFLWPVHPEVFLSSLLYQFLWIRWVCTCKNFVMSWPLTHAVILILTWLKDWLAPWDLPKQHWAKKRVRWTNLPFKWRLCVAIKFFQNMEGCFSWQVNWCFICDRRTMVMFEFDFFRGTRKKWMSTNLVMLKCHFLVMLDCHFYGRRNIWWCWSVAFRGKCCMWWC